MRGRAGRQRNDQAAPLRDAGKGRRQPEGGDLDAHIRHQRPGREAAGPRPVLTPRQAAILQVLLALVNTPSTDEWLAFRNRLAAEAALEFEAGRKA